MRPIIRELLSLSLVFLFAAGCKKSDPPTPLAVSTISPSHGPEYTAVTITGTGFSPTLSNDHVFLNGKEAVITSASSTQLVATVPRQAGTGNVSVTINGKTQAGGLFSYEYSDALVTTFAGSGTAGSADGTGTAASFNNPSDLAIDGGGNLYVADAGNNSIRKITPAGVVTTLAGGHTGFLDGTGPNARFNGPYAITIDAAGNLYVTDQGNNRVREITPAGVVTTLAGSGVQGYADGRSARAQFAFPDGLTADSAGNIYVADNYSRIRKISPQGVVSTLAGMSNQGYLDGPGTSAKFSVPRGMLADGGGNLFICDGANGLIRKITSNGLVSTLAGSLPGFADGNATVARFNYPLSVARDTSGNLVVGDEANNCIRLITPAGVVSTLAGSQPAGYADGNKANAKFAAVTGIAVDKNGAIYVGDYSNQRIRKIVLE